MLTTTQGNPNGNPFRNTALHCLQMKERVQLDLVGRVTCGMLGAVYPHKVSEEERPGLQIAFLYRFQGALSPPYAGHINL